MSVFLLACANLYLVMVFSIAAVEITSDVIIHLAPQESIAVETIDPMNPNSIPDA